MVSDTPEPIFPIRMVLDPIGKWTYFPPKPNRYGVVADIRRCNVWSNQLVVTVAQLAFVRVAVVLLTFAQLVVILLVIAVAAY